MKKVIILCSSLLTANLANAVPNFWKLDIAQGSYIYQISDTQNSSLTISCYLGSEIATGQELEVIHKGKEIQNTNKSTPLSFLIDDEESYRPLLKGGTYRDSMEWNEFVTVIPEAKKIDVYSNNKFLFTVKPKNSASEDISDVSDCRIN